MDLPKRLDIGCGPWKKEGFFGIDLVRAWEQPNGAPPLIVQADMFHDLNDGIPFPDNTIEEIYCSHFLEHIQNPFKLLEEIHRVCKNKAIVEIKVPLFELRFNTNEGKVLCNSKDCFPTAFFNPLKLSECSPDHITAFFPNWFERNKIQGFEIKSKDFLFKNITSPKEPSICIFEMTIILEVVK